MLYFVKLNIHTIFFQSKLPKLPVPLLDRTMKLYLETLKPILNEKQHEHVKRLVADFTSGRGPMLQEILIERREQYDNWVRIYVYMCVYMCIYYTGNFYQFLRKFNYKRLLTINIKMIF